jgi:hypothetical protein
VGFARDTSSHQLSAISYLRYARKLTAVTYQLSAPRKAALRAASMVTGRSVERERTKRIKARR